MVWADRQAGNGAAHPPQRGAEDVHAVDPGPARHHDGDQPLRHDQRIEPLALRRGKLLRIVEAPGDAALEQHRRDHHRPGQRAAAGLVDAGDKPRTVPPRPLLEAVGCGDGKVERQRRFGLGPGHGTYRGRAGLSDQPETSALGLAKVARHWCLRNRYVAHRFKTNLTTEALLAGAFTVRLDDTTIEALDRLAKQTDRSRSWLVSRAVEDYVALNEWQIAKIEEGLAAVRRGDFASDAEIAEIRRKHSKGR